MNSINLFCANGLTGKCQGKKDYNGPGPIDLKKIRLEATHLIDGTAYCEECARRVMNKKERIPTTFGGKPIKKCCYFCEHDETTTPSGMRLCRFNLTEKECGPENGWAQFKGNTAYRKAFQAVGKDPNKN